MEKLVFTYLSYLDIQLPTLFMHDVYLVSFSCVQYLQDVSCPFGVQERQEALDWLLGLAVRFEYGDNGKMSILVHQLP